MRPFAEFEIIGLPWTINQKNTKHWAVRGNHARLWKKLVLEQCIFLEIQGLRLKSCELILTRYSSRECDFDNLASSFKHVIDGLVEAEVIIDDKPSVIGSPTFQWQKCKKGEGKISVRLYRESSGKDE